MQECPENEEGTASSLLSLKAYWIDEGSHDEILALFS